MKRIFFIILVLLSFLDTKAQFPSTDSLRSYNIVWITNNAARAFTNYRLHTLLAGMIDWIDSARASGGGGGGAIGIDSIAALNDSTIRYRKNGTFRTFNLKGVYDSRRKLDTLYKTSDSTFAFTINNTLYSITMPGRTNFVDSIYRKPGQDSIFYRKQGVEYALLDSTGGGGSSNVNTGSGFRILNEGTQEMRTLFPAWGQLMDSTTNTGGLTTGPDTTLISTRAWRKKGDDSVAAVLRGVIIDSAAALHLAMSDSVIVAVSNNLIPSRIEFVHAGSSSTTYQNDTLIGKQIVDVSIEGYKLGFIARSTSIYMEFDTITGTITLHNGEFLDEDYVLVIYRTPPIFLLDGSGKPIRDGSGNFIILN